MEELVHHRDLHGGAVRAGIFGASDGLVTNVSLILGVAGAHPATSIVRLAGIAGMIAGAFSMAAGEYVSMKAQTELLERELEVERKELKLYPEGEKKELANIYESRGVEPRLASELAHAMMKDEKMALEVHAREELGIDPYNLGSPLKAATASLFAFIVGAFIPLIPWLVIQGNGAILASIGLGFISSATIGVSLARFTGRSMVKSAFRQICVAALAAGVTYGVGSLVGVGTS